LARYDALARDVGIDGKTAKGHIGVLERLFLVRVRQPWHVNLSQRQVKASATVRARDFRGLVHMRERLGQRLVIGVVLYAGEQTLPFGEGLWALPFNALWTD